MSILVTQDVLEVFGPNDPHVRVTQALTEMYAEAQNHPARVTQMILEVWAPVPKVGGVCANPQMI